MSEIAEVVIVQALVTELAIEALDVGVLRRLASCDELQIYRFAVGPAIQRAAGELWPLVGTNRPGQAAKLGDVVRPYALVT